VFSICVLFCVLRLVFSICAMLRVLRCVFNTLFEDFKD